MGFKRDIEYEHQQFERADAFYEYLGYSIQRVDMNTPESKDLQMKDIDVIATKSKHKYRISEKFSSRKDGDFVAELFHSRTKDHKGWSDYGESDFIFYFHLEDKKVHCVNTSQLQSWLSLNQYTLDTAVKHMDSALTYGYRTVDMRLCNRKGQDSKTYKLGLYKDREGHIILFLGWDQLKGFGIACKEWEIPDTDVLTDEELKDVLKVQDVDHPLMSIGRKVEKAVVKKLQP